MATLMLPLTFENSAYASTAAVEKNLKEAVASHNKKSYKTAIKKYDTVINSSSADKYSIAFAKRNKARAEKKQTVHTAKYYLTEGNKQVKSKSHVKAMERFAEGYVYYKSKDLKTALDKSAAEVLKGASAKHRKSDFSGANKEYKLITNISGVKSQLKTEANKLILFANEKMPLTDKLYKKITIEVVDTTKAASYTYEEMQGDIKILNVLYKGKFTVESIGKSVLNKDLVAIILGNPNAEKKLLVHGSIHAREHMTTPLVMKQLEFYLQNYSKGTYQGANYKDIFNEVAIYYIPMVNPDGVALVQKGIDSVKDQSLRSELLAINGSSKDFSKWKANINGVDLNRNFDANWDLVENIPDKPAPLNYRGESPESEPESKALADYTRTKNFDSSLSYHSSGSIIFWYYFQEGEYLERDKKHANMLAKLTGYRLVGVNSNLNSHAGFKDWHIKELNKPAYTMEIGKNGSPLALKEFPDIWERNKFTTLNLAKDLY